MEKKTSFLDEITRFVGSEAKEVLKLVKFAENMETQPKS